MAYAPSQFGPRKTGPAALIFTKLLPVRRSCDPLAGFLRQALMPASDGTVSVRMRYRFCTDAAPRLDVQFFHEFRIVLDVFKAQLGAFAHQPIHQ